MSRENDLIANFRGTEELGRSWPPAEVEEEKESWLRDGVRRRELGGWSWKREKNMKP